MAVALPTFSELYAAFRAEVQSRRPDLTDWIEGSVLDAIAGGGSMLADESIRISVEQFAELFFDTATAAALDRLALDRLGLVRKVATAAYGTVTVTKGAPTAAYTVPEGTAFRATVGGETFTATALYDVAVRADQATVDVAVQASVTGRSSNLAAGTLDEFVSALADDPTATCANAAALAGGTDEETDAVFRDRIRRYYSTLRRGTRAALETGALSVPGVSSVYVDESAVEASGIVYVYVGDPDGRSNDVLAGLVEAEMVNWAACGVLVTVLGASREEVALTLEVDIERGADQVAAATGIRASVVGYGDELAPGKAGRKSRIERAVHDSSASVLSVRLTSHTADVEPTAPHKAVRFTASAIAIAFTEVDP